jgi:hypothetical protein
MKHISITVALVKLSVVPAQAVTYSHDVIESVRRMGPRLRGDDGVALAVSP